MLEHLLTPWSNPASRTWWVSLLPFALVALPWLLRSPAGTLRSYWHSSCALDLQLMLARQLLGLFGRGSQGGLALSVGVAVVTLLQRAGLQPLEAPSWAGVAYSLTLFVVWDFSRFITHWLLHRVPALWALHQVHHSAERLTPLTFYRVHPLESVAYWARGAFSTGAVAGLFYALFGNSIGPLTLLGAPVIGLALNMAYGNLRHSPIWVPFPPWLERWFISPAQHQIHHGVGTDHLNIGTWLAVWDRLFGTLALSEEPPEAFGLAERNHEDDLLSAWFDPLRSWLPRGLLPLALALLLVPTMAQAEDPDEEEEPPEVEEEEEAFTAPEAGMSILVVDEDGTPRVAGSAYVVDEERLETFEYDNIEQVLAEVPGVTARGEDGYGLRPNLGIRGANSDRSAKLTLMEDGVLLAPAPYAAPAAYYFPMNTRMVAVEVFKGPAATRFGPQTVGGAVNLRTRPVPEGTAWSVDLAVGLRQTGKVHAWAGIGGAHAGFLIEGVHLRSAGFKELDTGGPTGFDHSEAMAKGWWAPGSRNLVELKLGYANETSHETYLGLAPSDYAENPYRRYAASAEGLMTWQRTQVELAWTANLGDRAELRTVAYHHWLDRSWTKLNGFADGPALHELLQADPTSGQGAVYMAVLRGQEDSTDSEALRIGTNHRSFHSYGLQSTLSAERYGERVDHELELGLRLHADQVWRVHTERDWLMSGGAPVKSGAPLLTTLDSYATAHALSAHAHDDLRVGELHLLPGLRAEVVRTAQVVEGGAEQSPQTRVTLLPGAGALYSLTPWVDVFAGSYRGFSPVGPGQAEEVRPEISWNTEAGFRADMGERHAEVVGFFNDYKNLTGQCTFSGGCDSDTVDQQFNGGAVYVWGAEVVVGDRFPLPGELSMPATLTYAWTQSRFQTSFDSAFPQFGQVSVGDSLPYVPRHQASGRLGLEHPRGGLTAGVTWRSGLLDSAGSFDDGAELPALLLVDAALHVQVHPRLELYATGTNLTGSTAVTSLRPFGARPTAPLQVMVGVKGGS